jgi:hypothetical protein
VYAIISAMAGLFMLFNLYHILMFGLQCYKTAFVTVLYIGAGSAIAWLSYTLIIQFDWTGDIVLNDLIQSIIPTFL